MRADRKGFESEIEDTGQENRLLEHSSCKVPLHKNVCGQICLGTERYYTRSPQDSR